MDIITPLLLVAFLVFGFLITKDCSV